jgi:hypothetical protein
MGSTAIGARNNAAKVLIESIINTKQNHYRIANDKKQTGESCSDVRRETIFPDEIVVSAGNNHVQTGGDFSAAFRFVENALQWPLLRKDSRRQIAAF